MNQKIINVVAFGVGAAIGSFFTWKVVKSKMEREMQEEIDKFKEDYAICMGFAKRETRNDEWDDFDDEDDDEDDEDESVMFDYHNLTTRYSSDNAENEKKGEGDEVPYINGPYPIRPEEFADGSFDHELESLTYYADGILADDCYMKLDIEETIGEDTLEHFGDYVDDVIHVRNERLRMDYEVVRDIRSYAEVVANDPQPPMYAY